MKILLSICGLLAVLLCGAAICSALDYNVDLSLSAAEKYDDNIFLARSKRVGDFITVITPGIGLSTKNEKADVIIKYAPSFLFYAAHDEKNSITHQASGQGMLRLSERLNLSLSDTFIQTRETMYIRDLEGGPVVRGQETILNNTAKGGLDYRLSDQIIIQPSVSYTYTANSGYSLSDASIYSGTLGASYLLTDRTTLRANATYTRYNYVISSDATGQEYTLGLIHKFTPTFSVDLYGGVVITQIDRPAWSDTGFSGGISFLKAFETGSAILSYKQGVTPGMQSMSPLPSRVVSLRYSMPLTDSLGAELSAQYGFYKSVGSIADMNRRDAGGTAALSYKLTTWATAMLSYSYVNSDDRMHSVGGYYNHVVMVGIKLNKLARF